jgi:hypothetical protein
MRFANALTLPTGQTGPVVIGGKRNVEQHNPERKRKPPEKPAKEPNPLMIQKSSGQPRNLIPI